MWRDAGRIGEKGVGDTKYPQHAKDGKWELEGRLGERFFVHGEAS